MLKNGIEMHEVLLHFYRGIRGWRSCQILILHLRIARQDAHLFPSPHGHHHRNVFEPQA